jgi:hypothetical protein
MSTPSTRRLGAAAALGGIAFLGLAISNLANPPFDGTFDSPAEYAHEALSLATALSIAGLVALRRVQGAPRGAVAMAAGGHLLIMLGIAIGLALGEDPAWFGAIAAPGLLLWLIGTVRLGVHTWRAGALPRWTAVALALTIPVGMMLGEVGGSVVPGVLWLYLGLRFAVPAAQTLRPAPRAPARG